MYARHTPRVLAAAALFTLMVGAASAATPKQPAPLAATVQPQLTQAQPVVVRLSTASLEEYGRSNPADRTEVTRTTLVQRLPEHKAASSGTARS